MESRVGALYDSDRNKFELVAREWTWRYAMTDTLEPSPTTAEMRLVSPSSRSHIIAVILACSVTTNYANSSTLLF